MTEIRSTPSSADDDGFVVCKTAGAIDNRLRIGTHLYRCGHIQDGVSFQVGERNGGWVLAFDDLKRAYEEACRHRGLTPQSESVSSEKPRRWADQYDFDKSDPQTRLFVAASNWVDRCERAEYELARVKEERGVLALKLAGAECFIEEQRKKGNIK